MLLEGLRWMLAEQGLSRELREWWEPFECEFGDVRRPV